MQHDLLGGISGTGTMQVWSTIMRSSCIYILVDASINDIDVKLSCKLHMAMPSTPSGNNLHCDDLGSFLVFVQS